MTHQECPDPSSPHTFLHCDDELVACLCAWSNAHKLSVRPLHGAEKTITSDSAPLLARDPIPFCVMPRCVRKGLGAVEALGL